MKTRFGGLAASFAAAAALLLSSGGCYKPKADIDAFRPQAEKQLAAMEAVGKMVKALPPLTQDTLKFPDSKSLRFADPSAAGSNNVSVVQAEELSDFANPMRMLNLYVKDEMIYRPAAELLKSGRDPYISNLTKSVVDSRFKALLSKKYLVVVRITQSADPKVTGQKEYAGGAVRGEAYLCEVKEPPAQFGGFPFEAKNSEQVTAYTHTQDKPRAEGERWSAIQSDLEKQVVKVVHAKIKSALPEAEYPSYW